MTAVSCSGTMPAGPAVPTVPDGEVRAVPDDVVAAPAPDPAPVADPAAALQEVVANAIANAPPPAADPTWISIPALGVDTSLLHLDLRADEAEVPESFQAVGWYRQTVEPGTAGPAVVVGHVGSKWGPGVFHDLDALQPGDEIHVTDQDGTTRTFVVDTGALVDKYDRPANVFGRGEDRPELRLITCGGDFDPDTGHHVSNYVVWAHEAGT